MSWLYNKLLGSKNPEEKNLFNNHPEGAEKVGSAKLFSTNALIPEIEYINLDVIIGEIRDIKTKGLLPSNCQYEIKRSRFDNKIYVYFMHENIESMRVNPVTFETLCKHSLLLAKYSSYGIIKGKNNEWIIEVINHYDPYWKV